MTSRSVTIHLPPSFDVAFAKITGGKITDAHTRDLLVGVVIAFLAHYNIDMEDELIMLNSEMKES